MKAVSLMLAGGVAVAALASAAPAAAQYYPGYGYPGYGYGNPGNVVGNVINQVLGGGYGGYGNYGANSQMAVDRCAAAVTQRINRNYGGYAPYGGYGYNQPYAAGGQIMGITSVERRSTGGLRVRGVASSGYNAGYGYGYNAGQPNLSFKCNVDYRGYVSDVDLNRLATNYGYAPYNNGYGVTPYGSYYNYRRY
jgi:hypothetical protein